MLYQETTGTGNAIVFVHGNSQSLSIWDGILAEPILSGYTLIRLDLPGHGKSFRSSDPEKDYSLMGLGIHLKEHLAKVGAEEYIIVALSMAGNMVAEVIRDLPKCKGMVLVGSCVIGPQFSVSEIAQPNPYFGVTFDAAPTDDNLDKFLDTWAASMTDELKSKCIKMFRNADPAFRTQMGKTIVGEMWSDEVANLEQLNYPLAIVYGEEEKVVFPHYLERSSLHIWQNKIIMIKGAGHCCQLDNPADFAFVVSQYAAEIFTTSGA